MAATAITLVLLIACGAAASPSGSPAGFVSVTVVNEVEPGGSLLTPIHRAQLLADDGSVVGAWEATEAAAPVAVPPGTWRLEVFTVFLSDHMDCVQDPAASDGERCFQPTLGPGQVCSLAVDVIAGQVTSANFHVLPEGACRLDPP